MLRRDEELVVKSLLTTVVGWKLGDSPSASFDIFACCKNIWADGVSGTAEEGVEEGAVVPPTKADRVPVDPW